MAPSGTTSAALFLPKHERTVLVMGEFPYDSERDVICDRLREIFGQEFGVKEWFATGRVGSVGKVNFHTNAAAWIFFRKYKGKMFCMVQDNCGTHGAIRRKRFTRLSQRGRCFPRLSFPFS